MGSIWDPYERAGFIQGVVTMAHTSYVVVACWTFCWYGPGPPFVACDGLSLRACNLLNLAFHPIGQTTHVLREAGQTCTSFLATAAQHATVNQSQRVQGRLCCTRTAVSHETARQAHTIEVRGRLGKAAMEPVEFKRGSGAANEKCPRS